MIVIAAPSNLGLRPLRPGHEPGAWRAPAALFAAGLLDAVGARDPIVMARPAWKPDADPGTRLRNGLAMRAFNLALASHVATAAAQGEFALVVGGDCAILLGALAGARRHGPLSLVHVDGHSDFRHPGNYDPQTTLGAVAVMRACSSACSAVCRSGGDMKIVTRLAYVVAGTLAGFASAADLGGAVDKVMAPYAHADRPGCAVGLFDGGRTVLARGYGAADLAWRGVPR